MQGCVEEPRSGRLDQGRDHQPDSLLRRRVSREQTRCPGGQAIPMVKWTTEGHLSNFNPGEAASVQPGEDSPDRSSARSLSSNPLSSPQVRKPPLGRRTSVPSKPFSRRCFQVKVHAEEQMSLLRCLKARCPRDVFVNISAVVSSKLGAL